MRQVCNVLSAACVKSAEMIREHFEFRQTITTILADDPAHIAAAKAGMLSGRADLESYLFFWNILLTGTGGAGCPANCT